VVRLEEGVSFVVADLPGLIEGAHHGAGRGYDFLRHVERTRLFVHVLDVAAPEREPLDDLTTVNRELALYREELAQRPQLVALNKMDLLPPEAMLDRVEGELRGQGHEVFRISALTGEGVRLLMWRTAQLLAEAAGPAGEEMQPRVKALPKLRRKLLVEEAGAGQFGVSGDSVERLVAMTDLDNEEAVRHLHRQLERMGVIRKLRELGAKDGDRVRIGSADLEFVE
jgi:GTP-binding protein